MTNRAQRIMVAAFAILCDSSLASAQWPMTLNVDASQARIKILHASLSMPARPGPTTLVYPKWIPGEHMPSGPIANLAGLHIFADGAELQWRRDHPVVLGEYLKTIVLWPAGSEVGEHVIDVIADSEWALQFPQSRIDAYQRLVREERSVFGGVGHYRKYHWLLTLSDSLGSYGVEHHETADDRVAENTFVDDEAAKRSSLLLPHEFFHSWNGKTRRPAGLVNGGYEQPMRGDLLWVYEGLTN